MNGNLTRSLAAFAAKLSFEQLPSTVVDDARYRVLDWVGSALAGIDEAPSRAVTSLVCSMGGAAQATILTGEDKVPASLAALVNGTAGHAVEYDDGHKAAITHPGAVTIPPALAVGEHKRISGKDLMAAVAAGYEVMIRLGTAVNPYHYSVFHTTGTCGAFTAAAAAGRAAGLTEDKLHMALSIAGTQAAGLQVTFGSHAKPFTIGRACEVGVVAVRLAGLGMRGPEDSIAGKKGFFDAMAREPKLQYVLEGLGRDFLLPTASYKVHASCGHSHTPLDALLGMTARRRVEPEEVQDIIVETYRVSVELTGELKHRSADEAKFSLPYCLAVALLHYSVTLTEFGPSYLNNERVLELARKVSVVENAEFTRAFPGLRTARVCVNLKSGESLCNQIDMPELRPPNEFLERKFRSLASKAMTPARIDALVRTILSLEELDDISTLAELLRPPRVREVE